MNRRPNAHNPMVFRKATRPAGKICTRPGCGCFVRTGTDCQSCAADQDLATIQALGLGYPDDV